MTTTDNTGNPSTADNSPIADFSHCHDGILKKLDKLQELSTLIEPAMRARELAAKAVAFFKEAIFEHHLDEERELFPATLKSAKPGAERDRVEVMVKRLTDEHRVLESKWKALESELKRVAKGKDADVDLEEIRDLVTQYKAHATFEETEFLPLSQEILSRDSHHMAALGLSIHMRQSNPRITLPYI